MAKSALHFAATIDSWLGLTFIVTFLAFKYFIENMYENNYNNNYL